MRQLSIFLSISMLLAGCTGMNQAECLNANWELIGLEDGNYGRNLSYANRHQSDCSKYDSQIDMEAYRTGHAEGLRNFCRAENGFNLGRSGRPYSGICPSDLEDAFLSEYDTGKEFYFLDKEISDTKAEINTHLNRIKNINNEIDLKAERAVQLDISPAQRDRIQNEMRELQFEMLDRQQLVGDLQLYLEDKEYDLNELSQYFGR